MADDIIEPLVLTDNERREAITFQADQVDENVGEELEFYIPSLPEGKDRYFFVSYSSEDNTRVFSYVEELERRFKLSCVYADRDFQPGKDISENVKEGMARSLKVLLFLSPNFHASPWCKFEREFAFITSIENGVNCVIPVLLEQCEIPTTLVPLTYVDATNPDTDVPEKIASALVQTFSSSGFLPENLKIALSNFESGYSCKLFGERQRTCCPCKPSRYIFKISPEIHNSLERYKVKIPHHVLHNSVQAVNKSSLMWSYDYTKRCNLLCWSVMSLPFFFFLLLFIFLTYDVAQSSRNRLTPEESDSLETDLGIFTVVFPAAVVVLLTSLILCLPCCCRHKQRDVSLQRKLWRLFADEYIKHNVLVIFSGRKMNKPTLYIMRYNISGCKEYLKRVIMDNKNTRTDASTAEQCADYLIKRHVSDILPLLADDFDSLPEAPYNRHNVRKGKMCLCQYLEHNI